MSPEGKQRLIGAIVLIAFIALLIPFLFSNGIRKKPTAANDEIPINAERRQLIVKEIQNMNAPSVDQSNDQSKLNISDGSGYQTVETKNIDVNIDQINESILTQAEQLPINNQNQSFASTNNIVQTGINSNMVKTAHKPIAKTKIKTKKFWSVQVGSFSNQMYIQKLTTDLRKKGYRVFLQKITTPKKVLTRILVGREDSKEEASKIAKQIETSMKLKVNLVRR